MQEAQGKLRDAARKLFRDGRLDLLIGFEKGTLPGVSRPCFVRTEEEVDRLVWDASCSNNLTGYLAERYRRKPVRRGEASPPAPRIGVVVKGCDALSLAVLVRERQVPREHVVVVGMPCRGMVDRKTGDILPSCLACAHPVAEGVDVRIAGESRQASGAPFAEIEAFEKKPAAERRAYFLREMSKCIRCHACREACPNCYCKECFADRTDPRWVGVGDDLSDTILYHVGRMFHQVGRCVGCDACARACPMGVDLRTFTHKLARDAKDLFDFSIGFSPEDGALLSEFKSHDSDEFITDPDRA